MLIVLSTTVCKYLFYKCVFSRTFANVYLIMVFCIVENGFVSMCLTSVNFCNHHPRSRYLVAVWMFDWEQFTCIRQCPVQTGPRDWSIYRGVHYEATKTDPTTVYVSRCLTMAVTVVFGVVVGALALVWMLWRNSHTRQLISKLPGPSITPLFGNLLQMPGSAEGKSVYGKWL